MSLSLRLRYYKNYENAQTARMTTLFFLMNAFKFLVSFTADFRPLGEDIYTYSRQMMGNMSQVVLILIFLSSTKYINGLKERLYHAVRLDIEVTTMMMMAIVLSIDQGRSTLSRLIIIVATGSTVALN